MKVVFRENRESVRQASSKSFDLSYHTPRRQNINGGGKEWSFPIRTNLKGCNFREKFNHTSTFTTLKDHKVGLQ
jgi:hypothetical protein